MPRASKSSLTDHRFPAFYACYLLKSVRTPRATATYIGSTPSPPRRIRQHNGLISQGAWKTKYNRPWIMQMIVYGFPSKLAALQFEWAWQHPHISRHLRDNDGKAVFNHSGKFKYLNANVRVARSMVSSHPYDTWPLSVKLFTEEAEKTWNNATKDVGMPPLPPGLRVITELEGVDGKSGKTGTGRTGPIDVTDELFTSEHLRKASAVFSSGSDLRCSICHRSVEQDANPLSTALCPTSTCTAVSHLSCLSRHFLDADAGSSNAAIIPRGGTCNSCHSYTLWGDVIRGCYRRREGGVIPDAELEDGDDREEDVGQLFGGDIEDDAPEVSSRLTKPSRSTGTKKRRKARALPGSSQAAQYSTLANHVSSDEQEHFDLDAISSTSDEQDSDDGRPQWHSVLPSKASSRPRSSRPASIASHSLPLGTPTATTAAPGHPSRGLPDRWDHAPQQISHTLASSVGGTVTNERGGRPKATVPAASGAASYKDVFQEEHISHSRSQTSRKPHSADTAKTSGVSGVDPAPVFGGLARSSCPPLDLRGKAVDSVTEGQILSYKKTPRRPRLRPFPDIPPLSPPHLPMGDRGGWIGTLDNEVVEISD
ncbi:hypothetical protein C8Q80DRAFT_466557 [Daedaleopsis nitida]|nr:hypothetical protein C8Q80DRAFT_466557 [Daedaleopsis nitida]